MIKTLLEAASPLDTVASLRQAAQAYANDAQELAANWQDDKAGKVWADIARDFEKLADKIERNWSKP